MHTNEPNRDYSKLIDLSYIVELAQMGQHAQVTPGYRPFVLLPQADGSIQPAYLEADFEAPLPHFVRQRVLLYDLESFIRYIEKFKLAVTVVFVDMNGGEFVAVLDYHGDSDSPGRGAHRACYKPQYSPEFLAWRQIRGKPLTQEQFLEHLRAWGSPIQNLTDADLIEMASSLDFNTTSQFSSHVERVKGGRKLLINEVVEGSAQLKGKTVTVPDKLQLSMPVFLGSVLYDFSADLLYRPQNGALRITVELNREPYLIRAAVKHLMDAITEETGIQPFIGEPA